MKDTFELKFANSVRLAGGPIGVGQAMCNCRSWEESRIIKVYDWNRKCYVLKCQRCGWEEVAP